MEGIEHRVREVLRGFVAENEQLFLVGVCVSETNEVRVVMDGDKGISLGECIRISRALEESVGKEANLVEVSSFQVGHPIVMRRQYMKNKGRTLKVVCTAGIETRGILVDVDRHITLEWTEREPKKIGRGKRTVKKRKSIPFEQIREARVEVSF